MKKTTTKVFVLATALLLGAGARAQAQMTAEQKAFVNVNVGVQLSDRSISTSSAFSLYDEEATVSTTQPVTGGVLFDFGAGYRVWGDVFAGLAVSKFGDDATSTGTASIPHPLFSGQHRTVSFTETDLKRRETGIHLQVLWFAPVGENLDLAVFAGPSFIRLSQELVSTVSVATNTQNATPVVVSQSGTGTGFNIGVDGSYSFTPLLGAGVFFRYVRGTVDLDSLPDAKASSVQIGVGARLRF